MTSVPRRGPAPGAASAGASTSPTTSPVSRSRTSDPLHRGHRSIDVRPARRRASPRRPGGPGVDPGRCRTGPPSRPSRAASPAAWTARSTRLRALGRPVPALPHPVGRDVAGRERRLAGHPGVERQRRLDARRPRPRRAPGRADPGPRPGRAAWTMTLAMRLSYSGGIRSPSTRPVSTRTPGPAGIRQRRTVPGRRGEVARRVLGGQPDLDRVAVRGRGTVRGGQGGRRQRLARPRGGTARGRGPGRSRAR